MPLVLGSAYQQTEEQVVKTLMLSIMMVVVTGCAALEPLEAEAGGTVPFGYTIHCAEHPDSVFCEQEMDNE